MTNSLVRWYKLRILEVKLPKRAWRKKKLTIFENGSIYITCKGAFDWSYLSMGLFRGTAKKCNALYWDLKATGVQHVHMDIFLKANTPESPQPRTKPSQFCAYFDISKLAYPSRQFYGTNTIKLKHLKQDPLFPAREKPFFLCQCRSLPILGDSGSLSPVLENFRCSFSRPDWLPVGLQTWSLPLNTNKGGSCVAFVC